jgi:protease-4
MQFSGRTALFTSDFNPHPHPMLQFLKYVLATIIGLFVFSVLLLFILIGIGSAASSEDPVAIEANSVLKLNFDEPIVERAKADPSPTWKFPLGPRPAALGSCR